MKFSVVSILLSAASIVDAARHSVNDRPQQFAPRGVLLQKARDACNADNCARAVTGTVAGTAVAASRSQDCSNYLRYTVTPATSTVTATVTAPVVLVSTITTNPVFKTSFKTVKSTESVTTFFVDTGSNAKRAVDVNGAVTATPTAVPSYASACSGFSRYSSACSCFGVTAGTTTLPTPVTTVTVTTTAGTSYFYTAATTTVLQVATVVVPATATAVVKACGKTVLGPYDNFQIRVQCNRRNNQPNKNVLSQFTAMNFNDCLSQADDTYFATSFDYQKSTRQCTIYSDTDDRFPSVADSDYDFGVFGGLG